MFDDNSGPQEAAFQRAIDMVNDDRTILTRSLVTKSIARYPQDDSFKASKKLCELIQPGIAAVFGPSSPFSANHVQSVSEALHVPFRETSWDFDFKRSDYCISVHPHPSVVCESLYRLCQKSLQTAVDFTRPYIDTGDNMT